MIYIPKKIAVGFQERKDTYTGKLAYVIYYDENGKLRKEASWNNWRDEKIQSEEYDNEPTEGFVLNKKVGGDCWGWNPRQTYSRIYDPRGYEFEITIPNLLWILENCNCMKGKGLEGEFVYGWDGKDLLLIPVSAPEYQQYIKKSELRDRKEFISAKDLVPGKTYTRINGEKYVYLGRYDKWSYTYKSHNGFYSYGQIDDSTDYIDLPWYYGSVNHKNSIQIKQKNEGLHYWFMCLNTKNELHWKYGVPELLIRKSVSKYFIPSEEEEGCDQRYPEFVKIMKSNILFSEIDPYHIETVEMSFDEFLSVLEKLKNSFNYSTYFLPKNCDKRDAVEIWYSTSDDCYRYRSVIGSSYFTLDLNAESGINVKKIYEMIQPVYKIFYLKNGKEFYRRFDNGIK